MFNQPKFLNRMNCGTIVTVEGSIIVASSTLNQISLPGQRSLAKEYPTSAEENRVPTTFMLTRNRVFIR